MDHRSFDRLARLLGEATDRRAGVKAFVGGLLGVGGAAAALDADATRKDRDTGRTQDGPDAERRKKKRKKCTPACEGGFTCEKGACVCPSGVTCAGACCASGQSCVDGACADAPDPATCIEGGQPCKNVGRECCGGRVCSSGQGGDRDIACYAPKTGRCERTADCVYGMACQDGRCMPPPPVEALGEPCDATAQQLCATSGAVCTAYTGPGAPGGTYCTMPLRKVCSGDPQCTCYKCWYVRDGVVQSGGRQGRASTNTMACCHPQGQACSVDQDCCLGLDCVNGFCGGGTICTPDEAEGCDTAPCCNPNALCRSNVCQLGVPTGEICTVGGLPCLDSDAECRRYGTATTGDTRCLLDVGESVCERDADCASQHCKTTASPRVCVACVQDGDCTSSQYCRLSDNACQPRAATGTTCAGGVPCLDAPTASCTTYALGSGAAAGDFCVVPVGQTCAANAACASNNCASGTCASCLVSPIETKMAYAARFAVKPSSGDTTYLSEIDYVAIDPDAVSATDGYAWVSGRNGARMARVKLSDRSVTVSSNFFSNYYLTGVGVSSDGVLVLVAAGNQPATAATGIYRVKTADANPYGSQFSPNKWITYPAPDTGSATTGYRNPEGLLYEGTSTNGTLWVGIWRGWSGGESGAASKSDILTYAVAGVGSETNPTSGVGTQTTLSTAYENVCGNASLVARQITRSGRTGDSAYLYIACDNGATPTSTVVVLDPAANSGAGEVVKTIPVPGSAFGISFLGDTMYVSDPNNGKIHPIALSGTGATMTYDPLCVLAYQTNPFPKGMALDTRSTANGGGNVWLGAYTGAMMTVTTFQVCTGTATNGVCSS